MILEKAVFDGFEYGFRFRYLQGALQPVLRNGTLRGKYVSSSRHRSYQHWRYPRGLIEDEEVFGGWIAELAAAVRTTPESIRAEFDTALGAIEITPNAFIDGITETLYPLRAGGFVVVGSSYHGGVAVTLRAMGGTYLKEAGGWHLPGASPAMIVNNLVQAGIPEEQIAVMEGEYDLIGARPKGAGDMPGIRLPASDWLAERAGAKEEVGHGQVLAKLSAVQRTSLTPEAIRAMIPAGVTLSYQDEGVVFLASRTGALIADDMGTGKTRTSIIAAYIARTTTERRGVVVVAPKSVLYKWQDEILAVFPDERTGVFDGDEIPDADWVICNYERLDRLMACADRFAVMLVDEAHKLKEPGAQRTQLCTEMAAHVPLRYMLTATPILNRESELQSLLRITGHPLGDMEGAEFAERFSGSREFRAALNRIIAGEWMIRRLKSQVLKGKLLGKQHHYPEVTMSPELAARYQEILSSSTNPLTRIHKVRRLLEEARIEEARKYVATIPAGEKLIVFTEYVESAHKYAEALAGEHGRVVVITGAATSEKARYQAIQALQTDDGVVGCAGTYGTISEGVDMWRANHVFLASQPWVPAIQAQAEDRANRLGQTRLVHVVSPLFLGTIDFDIRALLREKTMISQETIDVEEAEREAKALIGRVMASAANSTSPATA